MKKMFLAAVIGASALFTACGDDSSSASNSPTCSVNKGSKVTITMSQDGKTGQIEYALDGDNLIITTDGEVETTSADGMTLDDIGTMAEGICEEFMKDAISGKDAGPSKDDTPSGGDCFTLPEPNGESHQGCWYTSDATSATQFEVTAVGVITRTWAVDGGKVTKTTDYDDGNAPSVEEEPGMSSLEEAIEEAKGFNCKKIKTAMCEE